MADESVNFVVGGSDACPSSSGFEETGSCCYQYSGGQWVLRCSDCEPGYKCVGVEKLAGSEGYEGQYVRIQCVAK